jgi:hypothetical protein
MRRQVRPAFPWEGGGGIRGAVRRLGWRWLGGSLVVGAVVGIVIGGPGAAVAFALGFPFVIFVQELAWGGQNERVDHLDDPADPGPPALIPTDPDSMGPTRKFIWRHKAAFFLVLLLAMLALALASAINVIHADGTRGDRWVAVVTAIGLAIGIAHQLWAARRGRFVFLNDDVREQELAAAYTRRMAWSEFGSGLGFVLPGIASAGVGYGSDLPIVFFGALCLPYVPTVVWFFLKVKRVHPYASLFSGPGKPLPTASFSRRSRP